MSSNTNCRFGSVFLEIKIFPVTLSSITYRVRGASEFSISIQFISITKQILERDLVLKYCNFVFQTEMLFKEAEI